MNDTDKWASGIINEILEESAPLDRNVRGTELMEDKRHKKCKNSENELIQDKYEPCLTGMSKFIDKPDALFQTTGKPLSTNDGHFEELRTEDDVLEVSPGNVKNDYLRNDSKMQGKSLSLNSNSSNSESDVLLTDTGTSEILTNSSDMEIIRDIMNEMLSITEGKNYEIGNVSEIDESQFYKTALFSTPLKSDFPEKNFVIKETKTEKQNSVLPDLDLESIQSDEKNSLAMNKKGEKVKLSSSMDYEEQNNEKNNRKCKGSHYLTDMFKEGTDHLGSCDSIFKKRYSDESNWKSNAEICNDFGVKESIFSVNDSCNLENGDIKAKDNANHRSLDSIYQKHEERNLKRSIFSEVESFNSKMHNRNSESLEIYPASDTKEEKINFKNEALEYFTKKNGSPSQTLPQKWKTSLDDISDEDEIVLQRTDKVITVYRNICVTVEGLFIRPCSILIAESIDWLVFIFFLSICLLYMLYETVSSRIFSCISEDNEMQSIIISEKGNNDTILPYDECSELLTNSQEYGIAAGDEKAETEESRLMMDLRLSKIDEMFKKNFRNNNALFNVHPEEVLITHFMPEKLPKSEEMGETGEYFELNEGEKRATVKSYKDSLVAIVLQERVEAKDTDMYRNDFDMEVVASSTPVYEIYACKRISLYKMCKLSLSLQDLSTEHGKISKLEVANSDISGMTSSNIFDRDEQYINSTALGDSVLVTRAKSKNSCNFKLVDFKSDGDLSDASKYRASLENPIEKQCSFSSMNINLPSFNSRSNVDLLTDSLSFLNKTDSVCDGQRFSASASSDIALQNPEMAPEIKIDALVDLSSCNSKDFGNREVVGMLEVSMAELDEKSSKNLPQESVKTECSENFEIQNSSKHSDDSPPRGDAPRCSSDEIFESYRNEFHPQSFAVIENAEDSEIELEIDSTDKKGKISKGLRRRMSLILNNWKNLHCATANPRKTKKYKKHVENA